MSFTQILVILVIALIVLGPEKLPQVARMAGKALAELRRITGDFRSTIEGEMREIERETALKEARESFPPHIHYDLQTEEATLPPESSSATTPAATQAETQTDSGKANNGESKPA